jgi:hypothetical protein
MLYKYLLELLKKFMKTATDHMPYPDVPMKQKTNLLLKVRGIISIAAMGALLGCNATGSDAVAPQDAGKDVIHRTDSESTKDATPEADSAQAEDAAYEADGMQAGDAILAADSTQAEDAARETDSVQPEEHCELLIPNSTPGKKVNIVMAFTGLTDQEMTDKARDIARAQFFRSEYDMGKKTDPLYGFMPGQPNAFLTRAGLFEIEPFSSMQDDFHVYFLNKQIPLDIDNAYAQVNQNCPQLQKTTYSLVVLRHSSTPYPNFNAWSLEDIGYAFNHEFGHEFGLYDEYNGDMRKNDLSVAEVADWNSRIPNCDYNHPQAEADYATGNGYCTKWCKGVDPAQYSIYSQQRALFDQCEEKIRANNRQDWDLFCTNNMNFSRVNNFYGYIPLFYDRVPNSWSNAYDSAEACTKALNVLGSSTDQRDLDASIQNLCYQGTLFNSWDLNIGKDCELDTGCYAGCGGFGRTSYQSLKIGAFGDAFRPNVLQIMQGGIFYASCGPDFMNSIYQKANDESSRPSYGQYDIELIRKNILAKIGGN